MRALEQITLLLCRFFVSMFARRVPCFTKVLQEMKQCKRYLEFHWRRARSESNWAHVNLYLNYHGIKRVAKWIDFPTLIASEAGQPVALFRVARFLLGKKDWENSRWSTMRTILNICQIQSLEFTLNLIPTGQVMLKWMRHISYLGGASASWVSGQGPCGCELCRPYSDWLRPHRRCCGVGHK